MHCFPASLLAMVLCLAASRESVAAPQPAEVRVAGDWSVDVQVRGDTGDIHARVEIPPATLLTVSDERYDWLPIFNPKTAGWVKGTQLRAVRAQETTTPFLLDPASLLVRSAPGTGATTFQPQVDFDADLQWGTFGRLAGGAIAENQPVFATYRYTPLRLDSIILTRRGQIVFRPDQARAAAPQQPTHEPGERRLANLWIPGLVPRLSEHHLFPILETEYVKGLRQFGAENQIAVADAARRYGRLWRQGIPHTSVMLNSINHPDAGGMAIFADALMELFPKR